MQRIKSEDCSTRVKLEQTASSNSITLDSKQQNILDLCLTGKNVFFTGLTGTGKTFLLRHIAKTMRARFGPKRVVVVCPTGIAAIIAGGITLHSRTNFFCLCLRASNSNPIPAAHNGPMQANCFYI